ncbi:MAG: aminomethyl-transferring glycine dehydrogenase subunit GcvPA [Candidatus Eremiobacteraeota bacterium]|nr:aminomethyl-transferring glycine dehydrogenase subunit GcvPA [Candidatus Eremiobacteraeota bacterium]MBC5828099.1 aminomethyl-transferring glycine dehydrogenase subunit GcvPA [Candidatus Eremiobacteraeota bacterium]
MYAPHTDSDVRAMLDVIGEPSLEALSAPPPGLEIRQSLGLAPPMAESDAYTFLRSLASANQASTMPCFLGAGAYRHYIPPAVPWFATRSEFLTAYTPYQAEASQGSLQAIYEWQTYICLLTGLDVSNASVYDGATALLEGVIMAANATGRRRVAVSRAVHPLYRAVLSTYAAGMGIQIDELEFDVAGVTVQPGELPSGSQAPAAVVIQSPNFFGCVEDMKPWSRLSKNCGALSIQVIAEALSLAVLKSPGESGVDVAVGEAQSLGLPLGYGGPYCGFVAATKEHVRRLPGRLVGETTDVDGRRAYVLTLQGREQHIRRELATSNICTNQALCALIVTVYLATVGAKGLRAIAVSNLKRARQLAEALREVEGISIRSTSAFFNEFVVDLPLPAADVADSLQRRGILAGLPLSRFYPQLPASLLVCATELTSASDIRRLSQALAEESRHAVAAV